MQAVLGILICRVAGRGSKIDAGSLRCRTVVVDDNPTGTVDDSRRCCALAVTGGATVGVERHHTAVGCATRRPIAVLGKSEEKEIAASGRDIGIEELRPPRAAGGGGSVE